MSLAILLTASQWSSALKGTRRCELMKKGATTDLKNGNSSASADAPTIFSKSLEKIAARRFALASASVSCVQSGSPANALIATSKGQADGSPGGGSHFSYSGSRIPVGIWGSVTNTRSSRLFLPAGLSASTEIRARPTVANDGSSGATCSSGIHK